MRLLKFGKKLLLIGVCLSPMTAFADNPFEARTKSTASVSPAELRQVRNELLSLKQEIASIKAEKPRPAMRGGPVPEDFFVKDAPEVPKEFDTVVNGTTVKLSPRYASDKSYQAPEDVIPQSYKSFTEVNGTYILKGTGAESGLKYIRVSPEVYFSRLVKQSGAQVEDEKVSR